MKKFIIFIFCILSPVFAHSKGYDMTIPVSGDSIANDNLQHLVLGDIYKKVSAKHATCLDFSVLDTKIAKYPYNVVRKKGKFKSGFWDEMWTINVCGKKVQVPVSYTIHKNYTSFYVNENLI